MSIRELKFYFQHKSANSKERRLLNEIKERDHELAIIMDAHHLYPWCCKTARGSRGWSHDGSCKNWVTCY